MTALTQLATSQRPTPAARLSWKNAFSTPSQNRDPADNDTFKQPATNIITVVVPHVSHEASLEAVLRGFALQSDNGFEIAVVESDARQTTAAMIERCKSWFQHPIRHIPGGSNERLAEARNRVIAAADNELCILMGSAAFRGRISLLRTDVWRSPAGSSAAGR